MELKIEYLPVASLMAYEGNAKIHTDEQIEQIAESIREFGFNDPVGICGDTIVEGHGRVMAATRLGMDEVPAIRLDHLTDTQRRAYTLVHNKLTMNTDNDLKILAEELEKLDLEDFDMSRFDFTMPDFDDDDDDDDGYYGDARENTYNAVNLNLYDETRVAGFYQMPVIEPADIIPDSLIGFNYVKSMDEADKPSHGVHFFIDDYQFERMWNRPKENIERLRDFQCVLTPDWSLYMDMPIAMKIWNTYRARLVGQIMQDEGLIVVPTLVWAEPATYDFVFDGLGEGGTFAVSTVGVMKDKNAQAVWVDGMTEALKRLKPKTVLCYGSKIDFDFGDTKTMWYSAREWKE